MSGFVAAYREALDHPLFFGNAERLGAWMWLVMRAAWKPTPFDIGGKIITIERGQLCASRAQLAKAWGMSPSGVERFLTRLKTEQMIEQATGQGKSVITICNYSKYQDVSDDAGQETGQETGQQPDSNRTTKEQGNKGTRDNTDVLSHRADAPAKLKKPKAANTPFPENFQPQPFNVGTNSHRIMSGWPRGRIETELERFAANHRQRGTVMKDWQSAWSTWVLNTEKFGKPNNGNGNHNHQPDGGPINPMAQAVLARRAKRAGEQQQFFE
jgi:hypothetical protein